MIINIKVPDEAVKEIGVVLRGSLTCVFTGDCENCNYIVGCECLKSLEDACCGNRDISNSICEVSFSEE